MLEAAVDHRRAAPGDTTCAARGGGAWQGDRRLAVSGIGDPAFALIGTGFPFKDTPRCDEYLEQFRRVAAQTSGIRRPGAAALDLADVAAGRFDGFWEQQLSAWDIAAGMLLIREAGGVVTDFAGARGRDRAYRARGGEPRDTPVAANGMSVKDRRPGRALYGSSHYSCPHGVRSPCVPAYPAASTPVS